MHSVLREASSSAASGSSESPPSSPLLDRSKRFHPTLAYLTIFGGLGAVLPFLHLYFYVSFDLSYFQVGLLACFSTAGSSVASPLWGYVVDRMYSARRTGLLKRSVHRIALVCTVLVSTFLRFSFQFVVRKISCTRRLLFCALCT